MRKVVGLRNTFAIFALVVGYCACCDTVWAQRGKRGDATAPVRYDAIAGRLSAYLGREVLVEGRVAAINRSYNGVVLTVSGRQRVAFIKCDAVPPGVVVNQAVALVARVPTNPSLNYLEFVELYGGETASGSIADDPAYSKVKFDERGEELLLELVNAERQKAGLKPYKWNEKLRNAARKHSADMLIKNYVSHNSESGMTVAKRVSMEGVSYSGVGENVGSGPNVSQVHKSLMDSPGHRRNIMSKDFEEIGIGVVKTLEGGVIVTQNFIYKH